MKAKAPPPLSWDFSCAQHSRTCCWKTSGGKVRGGRTCGGEVDGERSFPLWKARKGIITRQERRPNKIERWVLRETGVLLLWRCRIRIAIPGLAEEGGKREREREELRNPRISKPKFFFQREFAFTPWFYLSKQTSVAPRPWNTIYCLCKLCSPLPELEQGSSMLLFRVAMRTVSFTSPGSR